MKIMMTSLTTTTTRLWSQALKVFKNLKLSRCASSVARCIPPAINVCILKICGVEQLVHGFLSQKV
jgi:hypothetical protein